MLDNLRLTAKDAIYNLYNGDCLEVLGKLDKHYTCLFADPPDNIGLGYGVYTDNRDDYCNLLYKWLHAFINAADIIWFSFNAKWTSQVGYIIHNLLTDGCGEIEFKPCQQVFTFGQHNKNDLGNNHRPLYRLKWNAAKLYPDAIKVESWRQRNGDKRAAEGGRVPGDAFDIQYPSQECCNIAKWLSAAIDDPSVCTEMKLDIEDWFKTHSGDVFDFPRVTGNSAQRCDWHPTQLHEQLVERCLRLSVDASGNCVDPFAGTGTTMRVAQRLGFACDSIEIDHDYCERIASSCGLNQSNPLKWGSTSPLSSVESH